MVDSLFGAKNETKTSTEPQSSGLLGSASNTFGSSAAEKANDKTTTATSSSPFCKNFSDFYYGLFSFLQPLELLVNRGMLLMLHRIKQVISNNSQNSKIPLQLLLVPRSILHF